MTTAQLDPPASVLGRSTLGRIDHADAFLLIGKGPGSAEGWARALLEGAPLPTRIQLLSGWSGLGIRLGDPRAEGNVLGWRIIRSTGEELLLGADSWLGLRGQLLFLLQPDGLLLSTLLQLDGRPARAARAGMAPIHRKVVPALLAGGERRVARRAA